MKVTLLVITDGRPDCLAQSVPAFDLCVDQSLVGRRVIVDDSGDPAYGEWIDSTFSFDERIGVPTRRGFAGAIQAGWDAVGGSEYVFHLEDDFVLARYIPLRAMVETLTARPHLAQMALKRQPWGPDEVLAGDYIAADPQAFHDYWDTNRPERRWLEHAKFFTTDPCVYPRWVTRRGWPQIEHSERAFGESLFRSEHIACGIWGHRLEPPWAIHVGFRRTGTGY